MKQCCIEGCNEEATLWVGAKDWICLDHNGGYTVKRTYAYHKLSTSALISIAHLREAFSALHDLIERETPHSRERSVALTNLETTAMWAIKAITHNDPLSIPLSIEEGR